MDRKINFLNKYRNILIKYVNRAIWDIYRRVQTEMTGISVIIPCFNCESSISRCLDSLIGCNYYNIQIIVVDDKSLDKSRERINSYIENHNNVCIRLIENEKNVGAGKTRNIGVSYADKEYITFVDADDVVDKSFFGEIDRVANLGSYDCIVFDAFIKEMKQTYRMSMFYGGDFVGEQELCPKCALVYIKGCTCGKAYKTSVIQSNKIKFADLKRNEDLVFTKTAVSYCRSVYYIDKALYFYCENLASLMHTANLLNKQNAHRAYTMIVERLSGRKFEEELHSIYVLEVVYSTTMTSIRKNDDPKSNFIKVTEGYKFKDRYYKKYNLKYRLILMGFRLGLFKPISWVV